LPKQRVIFDWDEQGFKDYLSDPEVPAIIKEAGHVGKPQPATLDRYCLPEGGRVRWSLIEGGK